VAGGLGVHALEPVARVQPLERPGAHAERHLAAEPPVADHRRAAVGEAVAVGVGAGELLAAHEPRRRAHDEAAPQPGHGEVRREEGGPQREAIRVVGAAARRAAVDERAGEAEAAPEEVLLRQAEPAVERLGAGRAEDEVGDEDGVPLGDVHDEHDEAARGAALDAGLHAREPPELQEPQAREEHPLVVEQLALRDQQAAQHLVLAHVAQPVDPDALDLVAARGGLGRRDGPRLTRRRRLLATGGYRERQRDGGGGVEERVHRGARF
jgi:hypothetical protein